VRFGERLQELRWKAGLSQGGLAKASGIPVRTIQNWEIGRRVPRADALFALGSALGVSCESFAQALAGGAATSRAKRPRRRDKKGRGK
jgi:transcriptional regulator with XRE-family HTH domain